MRWTWTAALAAACAVGIPTAAVALSEGETTVTSRQVDSTPFGILDRPRRPSDDLPAEFVRFVTSPDGDPALKTLHVDSARLAYRRGADRLYVVPRGDQDICLWASTAAGGTSMSCAPISSASDPSTPLMASSDHEAVVLVRDGLRGLRAQDASGGNVVLDQGENVAVAATDGELKSLSWTTPAGVTTRARLRVAEPTDP
jgi:hypothetical protein